MNRGRGAFAAASVVSQENIFSRFLHYFIFFFIFSHATYIQTYFFLSELIAKLLRERYVAALGKELPSQESRGR